jgi:hypothetical protein
MRDILALQAVWACRACQLGPPAKEEHFTFSHVDSLQVLSKEDSGEISKPRGCAVRIGNFRVIPSPFLPRPLSILLFPIPAE